MELPEPFSKVYVIMCVPSIVLIPLKIISFSRLYSKEVKVDVDSGLIRVLPSMFALSKA